MSSQKISALYPQIHRSRLTGGAACACAECTWRARVSPVFPLQVPQQVWGSGQWQVPEAALPGLSGVSLSGGGVCLALHVAASLLELSTFFPRLYPLGSASVSGSFFMLGIFKQAFVKLEACFW